MKVIKAIFRFLFSRRLWTFIGILLVRRTDETQV